MWSGYQIKKKKKIWYKQEQIHKSVNTRRKTSILYINFNFQGSKWGKTGPMDILLEEKNYYKKKQKT